MHKVGQWPKREFQITDERGSGSREPGDERQGVRHVHAQADLFQLVEEVGLGDVGRLGELRAGLRLWRRVRGGILYTAFAVCSPGCRAWVASPGAPGFPATAEGRVVARLRRGWSHLFLARRRSRGNALDGVEIRLDGLLAGRTDARGELWAYADACAKELEVAHPMLVWTDEDGAALDDLVTWLELHP